MTLRTKKKSSNDLFWLAAVTLPFLGLLGIMTFLVRVLTLQGTYGSVGAVIPVVASNIEDPARHNFREVPKEFVDGRTVTIAVTEKALFFGELQNFTRGIDDENMRYKIEHVEGSPQVGLLIGQLEAWIKSRRMNENIPKEHLLVLLPTKNIPMPILLQIMQALKNTKQYDNIILGTGIT
jgi:hypothetical protein